MNRQQITFLIALFWTSILVAQVQDEVKKVLETKDFVAFKNYADQLASKKKPPYSQWEYLRDLTTGFQEGVFIFNVSAPDSIDPSINSDYKSRVTVLSTDKLITYYQLSQEKIKTVGENSDWEFYFDPLITFKDEMLYERLKKSFRKTFNADLNENELFKTDLVFGEICGMGSRPHGRHQIDQFVKKKDKESLVNWLQSSNTEMQVYAVDGLYQLKKGGVKLTHQEIKTINYICSKKGTLSFCSGCFRMEKKIHWVTRKFKQSTKEAS